MNEWGESSSRKSTAQGIKTWAALRNRIDSTAVKTYVLDTNGSWINYHATWWNYHVLSYLQINQRAFNTTLLGIMVKCSNARSGWVCFYAAQVFVRNTHSTGELLSHQASETAQFHQRFWRVSFKTSSTKPLFTVDTVSASSLPLSQHPRLPGSDVVCRYARNATASCWLWCCLIFIVTWTIQGATSAPTWKQNHSFHLRASSKVISYPILLI